MPACDLSKGPKCEKKTSIKSGNLVIISLALNKRLKKFQLGKTVDHFGPIFGSKSCSEKFQLMT